MSAGNSERCSLVVSACAEMFQSESHHSVKFACWQATLQTSSLAQQKTERPPHCAKPQTVFYSVKEIYVYFCCEAAHGRFHAYLFVADTDVVFERNETVDL